MAQEPSGEDAKRIKLDVHQSNQSVISDTFHGQLKNTVSFICSLKMHMMISLISVS